MGRPTVQSLHLHGSGHRAAQHSGPLGRADFLHADVARTDRGPGLQRNERVRIRGPTERVPARAVPAVQGPDRSGADIRQRDDPADQRRRDRVGRRGRAVLVGHQGIQLRRKLVQQHLGSATLALADAQVQRLYDGHRHRADSVGHLEQHRHPDTAAPAPLHLDPDRQRPARYAVDARHLDDVHVRLSGHAQYESETAQRVDGRNHGGHDLRPVPTGLRFHPVATDELQRYLRQLRGRTLVPDLASDELADRAVRSRALVRL